MPKHPSLVAIGSKIRALRKAAGFSQEGFAAKIEMNRGYYGHIERGDYNFTQLSLFRIADALNVEPMLLTASLEDIRAAPIKGRAK